MIIFFGLLIVISLYGIKVAVGSENRQLSTGDSKGILFNKNAKWNIDYLSKEKTNAIKGVFVMIVLISHYCNYYRFDNPTDKWVSHFIGGVIGQLMVVMFLFYSGYGVMESYKRKGKLYAVNMPVQRILKLWFDFDVIVLIFFAIYVAFGKQWTVKRLVLSLVGWDSYGNSNWYIFAVFFCYVFSFIAFMIAKKKYLGVTTIVTVLCILFEVVVNQYKNSYWTNTILCYALGMWYSVYKEKIEKVIQKNNFTWVLSFGFLAVLSLVLWRYKNSFEYMFEIRALVAALFVVCATMKFSVDNAVLRFLGSYVFGIYMLQKVPTGIMENLGLIDGNYIYLKFAITIVLTVILAYGHNYFMVFTSKLFKRAEIKKAK